LDLSIFAALQLVVFADVLIRVWVGETFLPALTVTRVLILAVPPYLFFMALKSSIDAATIKPRNAGNVLIALGIYGALTAAALKLLPANLLLDGIAASLVVGLVVLGVVTARTSRQLYGMRVPLGRFLPSIIAGIILGGVSFGFRWIQSFHEPPLVALAFELLIIAVFFAFLAKLESPWLQFLLRNGFSGLTPSDAVSQSRAGKE
jgi:hypothetical protein